MALPNNLPFSPKTLRDPLPQQSLASEARLIHRLRAPFLGCRPAAPSHPGPSPAILLRPPAIQIELKSISNTFLTQGLGKVNFSWRREAKPGEQMETWQPGTLLTSAGHVVLGLFFEKATLGRRGSYHNKWGQDWFIFLTGANTPPPDTRAADGTSSPPTLETGVARCVVPVLPSPREACGCQVHSKAQHRAVHVVPDSPNRPSLPHCTELPPSLMNMPRRIKLIFPKWGEGRKEGRAGGRKKTMPISWV